ncbi:MAG: transcriptional repressor [Phycisphaerae bacterium]|nr:transcriptional repressor [Phycisphaerae bacterium]
MADRERRSAFEILCREHGLPITVQRRAVYEFIRGRQDHPTVDQVYDGVRDRIRGVSRMTVYRALNTLVDVGAVKKVSSPGPTIRYDANTKLHHHLVCMYCDKLIDYEDPALNNLPMPNTRGRGFRVSDYSIQFRGICADCRRKGEPTIDRIRGSTIDRKRTRKK